MVSSEDKDEDNKSKNRIMELVRDLMIIDTITVTMLSILFTSFAQYISIPSNYISWPHVLFLSQVIGIAAVFIFGFIITLYIRSAHLRGVESNDDILAWDISLTAHALIAVVGSMLILASFLVILKVRLFSSLLL